MTIAQISKTWEIPSRQPLSVDTKAKKTEQAAMIGKAEKGGSRSAM